MIGILLYLLTGIGAGLLAGLLGVGGGVIVVPALAFIFSYLNMPKDAIMHMAASTSLAAMIFTTFAAVLAQQKRQMINWPVFRHLAAPIAIGTVAGAAISSLLSTQILGFIFGVFMIIVALRMLLQKKDEESSVPPHLPDRFILYTAGSAIGALSGLLGIGGGALTVPILLHFGYRAHESAATSSACALLLSVIGTLIFAIGGWEAHGLPAGSTGYIYWPAALVIAFMSMIFVPLGTKLARRLSSNTLKRVFGGFMLVVGLDMLLK
jgi:uncharacterized membrane protein YfcA